MIEVLDPWPFIWAAYVTGGGGTVALMLFSWMAMRGAEARRDKVRRR